MTNTKNSECTGCKHSIIGECNCDTDCLGNSCYEKRFSMSLERKRKSYRKTKKVEEGCVLSE